MSIRLIFRTIASLSLALLAASPLYASPVEGTSAPDDSTNQPPPSSAAENPNPAQSASDAAKNTGDAVQNSSDAVQNSSAPPQTSNIPLSESAPSPAQDLLDQGTFRQNATRSRVVRTKPRGHRRMDQKHDDRSFEKSHPQGHSHGYACPHRWASHRGTSP